MTKKQTVIMGGVILLIVAVVIAITFEIILKRRDWDFITAVSLIPTLAGISCGIVCAKKKNEESKQEEQLLFWVGYVTGGVIYIVCATILVWIIATLFNGDGIICVVTGAIAAIIAAIVAFIWTNIVMSKK